MALAKQHQKRLPIFCLYVKNWIKCETKFIEECIADKKRFETIFSKQKFNAFAKEIIFREIEKASWLKSG